MAGALIEKVSLEVVDSYLLTQRSCPALPHHYYHHSNRTCMYVYLNTKVSGMKLDKYLKARVFEPLDMKDTGGWVK